MAYVLGFLFNDSVLMTVVGDTVFTTSKSFTLQNVSFGETHLAEQYTVS